MIGDIAVIIPGLAFAGIDLHDPNAAFDESAGDQAGVIKSASTIEIASGLRLAIEVEDFLRLELHAEGHLHRLDAGFERVIAAAAPL